MNKFKPGDRVRLSNNKNYDYNRRYVNQEGTISTRPHWSDSNWLRVKMDMDGKELGLMKNDKRWELAGHRNWQRFMENE